MSTFSQVLMHPLRVSRKHYVEKLKVVAADGVQCKEDWECRGYECNYDDIGYVVNELAPGAYREALDAYEAVERIYITNRRSVVPYRICNIYFIYIYFFLLLLLLSLALHQTSPAISAVGFPWGSAVVVLCQVFVRWRWWLLLGPSASIGLILVAPSSGCFIVGCSDPPAQSSFCQSCHLLP